MFMSAQEGGARRQPLVLGSTFSILLHPLSSADTLPFKSLCFPLIQSQSPGWSSKMAASPLLPQWGCISVPHDSMHRAILQALLSSSDTDERLQPCGFSFFCYLSLATEVYQSIGNIGSIVLENIANISKSLHFGQGTFCYAGHHLAFEMQVNVYISAS